MTPRSPALPTAPAPRVKPRWRGILHQYAFFASIAPVVLLVLAAPTAKASVAAAIYGASLAALLGTSALYHRVTWSPRARLWMGKLDLAMIFFLIAGSYTPIALLALRPPLSTVALWTVWGAAVAGIVLKLVWMSPPKWASSLVYVTMGSIGAFFLPEIARALGLAAVALFVAGGDLHRWCARVCAAAPRPIAGGVWLPRDLSCAGRGRGGGPLRRRRRVRPARHDLMPPFGASLSFSPVSA
jgi:hemolysin III